MNQNQYPILYAQSADLVLDKKNPSKLRNMALPAGDHQICCGCGPGGIAAAILTVRVDSSTAKVLNASLAKLNSENAPQKALFDFEHERRQAMAWPISFAWQDAPDPGVYVTSELSSLGHEYVVGKVARSFSLSFYTDGDLPKNKDVKKGATYEVKNGARGSEENPARIVGLNFPYIGSLTNDPAFRANMPLSAGRASPERRAEALKLAANRALKAEMNKFTRLSLERNNYLLSQLIRKDPSEERIQRIQAYFRKCREKGWTPNLHFHR